MRLETIKLYKFDELSEEAKERALDEYRYINVEYNWWEYLDTLLEPTQEEIEYLKIPITPGEPIFQYKIEAFDLDRGSYLYLSDIEVKNEEAFRRILGIPEPLWEYTWYSFENNRWGNNTKLSLELDLPYDEEPEEIEKYLEFLAEEYYDGAEEIWREMVDRALKRLRDMYFELMEDDAVVDTLRINEFEFTEDGTIW